MAKRSKLESLYCDKNYKEFDIELSQFASWLIKRYVEDPAEKQLEFSVREELKDNIKCRAYTRLKSNPWIPGKSDFRSYVYSIMRNGISSFNYRIGRDILCEEVRPVEPKTEFRPFIVRLPKFNLSFERRYPKLCKKIARNISSLMEEGQINFAVWEGFNKEYQNYIRIVFWQLYVKEI